MTTPPVPSIELLLDTHMSSLEKALVRKRAWGPLAGLAAQMRPSGDVLPAFKWVVTAPNAVSLELSQEGGFWCLRFIADKGTREARFPSLPDALSRMCEIMQGKRTWAESGEVVP